MDLNIIIGMVGIAVGIISLAYAIFTNQKLARLEGYNREQAWEIYRQCATVLAVYQNLKAIEINDRKIIESVSIGEMASQELVLNAIRMIKRFEKHFDLQTIEKWLKEGRLPNESHVKAFKSYNWG